MVKVVDDMEIFGSKEAISNFMVAFPNNLKLNGIYLAGRLYSMSFALAYTEVVVTSTI